MNPEGEPVNKESAQANPYTVVCPTCNARIGRDCTQPSDTGRRKITSVHDARKDLANGWT